ncbi:hypothetical protein [Nodularia sp. UHCC 0506]|uniref:hypothetical protein n=1 Tax=Nodularia sp. UHCC 0506 TaxID=3110243 RepID=UPI002B20343E|nr:hypothetical protein [Nodularia sp. UHCC 0506]MEA5514067.1 hypothetical protein [Nodularia sp. UHCC 0506]
MNPDYVKQGLEHFTGESIKIAVEKQGTSSGVIAGATASVSISALWAVALGCPLTMPVAIGAAIAGGFLFSGKKSK